MKTARQEILEKLKNISQHETELPDQNSPIYNYLDGPIELAFKKNLEAINGNVSLFKKESELYAHIYCFEEKLQDQLKKFYISFSKNEMFTDSIEVGITGCEFLIAQTGSIMVSSAQKGGRRIFVYPPIHVVIAGNDQLVENLKDAYLKILDKYKNNIPSQITLITGPSRTADIEKTLVLGAHGPKELHVLLYEN